MATGVHEPGRCQACTRSFLVGRYRPDDALFGHVRAGSLWYNASRGGDWLTQTHSNLIGAAEMGNATVAHAVRASWFDEDGLLEVLGDTRYPKMITLKLYSLAIPDAEIADSIFAMWRLPTVKMSGGSN